MKPKHRGHEEVKLALVKLYQVNRKSLYLEIGKKSLLTITWECYKPDGSGINVCSYSHTICRHANNHAEGELCTGHVPFTPAWQENCCNQRRHYPHTGLESNLA